MGLFSDLTDTPRVELAPNAGVPRSVSTPGGTLSTSGGVVSLTPSSARDVAVRGITEAGFGAARDIRGLREQVTPGFGALTQARLAAVDAARSRGIGNLRENLARRRVRGSSFGEGALISAEREFAQQEAEVRARSVLEELDVTRQLIGQETEFQTAGLIKELGQMNFETGVATQFAGTIAGIQQRNAQAQFEAAQKAAEASGAFKEKAFAFGGRVLGATAGFALGGPGGAALGAEAGEQLGSFAAGF